jgi:hypothetical protein
LPEYRVPGGRQIGFETHPAAALQFVVGGLVPENSDGSPPGIRAYLESLSTPLDLGEAVSAHLEPLRHSIEEWKRVARRLVRSGRPVQGVSGTASAVEQARAALEERSLEAAVMLREADRALRRCGAALRQIPFRVHLGLPGPQDPETLQAAAGQYRAALIALGAFRRPQDPDLPVFFAKADLLVEEAGESLRHVGRLARWLWTNEPDTHRLTELLQWAFDLRCECLELAPVLACLQTPLEIWREAEAASDGPGGSSARHNGGEPGDQEPGAPGASP